MEAEFDLSSLKVPELYIVTTGYDQEIGERADQFFDDVLTFLGYKDRARQVFTQRHNYWLVENINNHSVPTEEQYIHTLLVRERTAASVLVTRDGFNRCMVASAHYLNPKLVETLRKEIIGNPNNV